MNDNTTLPTAADLAKYAGDLPVFVLATCPGSSSPDWAVTEVREDGAVVLADDEDDANTMRLAEIRAALPAGTIRVVVSEIDGADIASPVYEIEERAGRLYLLVEVA